MEFVKEIKDFFSYFDLAYIVITLLSLFKCTKNGFVLSILSLSKWLLAYIITLILFPSLDLVGSAVVSEVAPPLANGIFRTIADPGCFRGIVVVFVTPFCFSF